MLANLASAVSVRAILALALTVAVVVLAFDGKLDPNKLYDLAILAFGFYFITKTVSDNAAAVAAAPVVLPPEPEPVIDHDDAPTMADLLAENAELRARLDA